MKALDATTIDYLSLDVEGFELKILKTIPYDVLNIKVISVEYLHTHEGKAAVVDFLNLQGFQLLMEIPQKDYVFINTIFFESSK